MKKWILGVISILVVVGMSCFSVFGATDYDPSQNHAGSVGREGHYWALGGFDKVQMPEISAPSGNPPADTGWLYVLDGGGSVQTLNFKDRAGTITNLLSAGSTKLDDVGDPDANCSITLGTYTNVFTGAATAANQNQFLNTGNMGDYAIVYIQQLTGTPTDGKLLYATTASEKVDGIHIYNSDPDIGSTSVLLRLDFADDDDTDGYFIVARDNASADTEFSVDMVGNIIGTQITVASTVLDVNSLDFVGAGAVTTGASSALTLNIANGDAAGEDLIITANNISLLATGALTISPDAALTTAIILTDTDLTNALSVGDNNIIGTTGGFTYTAWSIDASGNFTTTGTISGVTILQDAIAAKSAATTLTLDGKGTGGVSIGTVAGTGAVTLGGGGFATLVNLPLTVDLTLAGGQLSITDTANADLVTLVNSTVTTAEILDITAGGTRTSGSIIKITDAATTANTITITANTQTSGTGFSYTNTGQALSGSAIYLAVTDHANFTGYYIRAYDGAADDFSVKRYGATIIAGNASGTDALTLTNGDILVTAGNIDITTGTFTVGTGSIAIATNGNFSTARGGIQLDTVDDDSSYIKRNQTTTSAALFTIEETHTGADFPALVVTQNATGAFDGIDISYGGSTRAIHTTLTAAAGDGEYFTVPASYTGQLIKSDLLAWLGTSGEGGVIDIVTTAAATQEVGQGIRLNFLGTGTAGTAVTGKALFAHANAGIKAGESLVFLDTLFNTAIHIKNDGVSADGILIEAKDAYTGQGILGDLGAWLGTVNEGFLNITSDAAGTVVVGQMVRLTQLGTGQHSTAIDGSVIYAYDDAAAPAAGISYAVTIKADHIEALHVDVGRAQFDEGIGAGNASDSSYLTDTVEISSAEIKALRANKKELVATPGADYFIELVSAVLIYDYDTAVYSESADDLAIEYSTSGDDITAAIEMTGFIDQGGDMIMTVFPIHPQPANVATDIVNNAIRLINTGDGEYAGAGAGTMTVKVTYRIHKAGL
jgi:hypothetical protein